MSNSTNNFLFQINFAFVIFMKGTKRFYTVNREDDNSPGCEVIKYPTDG